MTAFSNPSTTPEFPLDDAYLPWLTSGRKQATIRRGILQFANPDLVLVTTQLRLTMAISDVQVKAFGALTEVDAKRDGFNTLAELRAVLLGYYPDITNSEPVTIIGLSQKS